MAYHCPSQLYAGAGRIGIIQAGQWIVNGEFHSLLIILGPLGHPSLDGFNLRLGQFCALFGHFTLD